MLAPQARVPNQQKRIASLEAENRRLSRKIRDLEAENHRLSRKIRDHEVERRTLLDQVGGLRKRIQQLMSREAQSTRRKPA